MMKKLAGIVLMFPLWGWAQPMDSLELPVVQIELIKLDKFISGSKSMTVDSLSREAHLNQSLAELLSDQGAGYFKSTGPGLLTTSALRGGAAAHTAFMWNGIPLNSSMNGVQDFSLVPVFLFDQVRIHYGGGSSHWGSGALGGAVHVSSDLDFRKQTRAQVHLGLGSFGAKQFGLSAKQSGSRIGYSVRVFRQETDNDFTYRVTDNSSEGEEEFRQTHSALSSTGLTVDIVGRIRKRQMLKFSAWLQKTDREIPSPIGTTDNQSDQHDESRRFLLNYQLNYGRHLIAVKTAWVDEQIDFNTGQTQNQNFAGSSISEVGIKSKWGKRWRTLVGVQQSFLSAQVDSYKENVLEQRTAGYVNAAYHRDGFDLTLSGRQALVDYQAIPFTYSLESTLRLLPLISWRVKSGSIYRLPSLNDRFWAPGGNVDLLPEKGWVAETGVLFQLIKRKAWSVSFEPDLFSRWVEDWIQWTPSSGIWMAKNVNKVWSRGLETQTAVRFDRKRYFLQLRLGTNYVLSTDNDQTSENYDQQLIYVPMYAGNIHFTVGIKQVQAVYVHQYTGYRFLSSDNTSALNPFMTGALQLHYQFTLWKYQLRSFCSISNIWDENYQLVAQRPMPGRQFNIGISLNHQFL